MLAKFWFGLLGAGILAGLVTVYQIYTTGFVVYAKTDVLVWTLPLASYIFFSLTSSGLAFVSSLPMVFGLKRYQVIEKRVLFVEITVLMAAFISLIMHLGSPINTIWLFLSPNPASPLWWLAMLYGLYLVALLATFWSVYTGKAARVLGVLVLLIAVGTSTGLGWLLGMTDARPVLNASFLTLFFPLTAFACGLAAILLFNLISSWARGAKVGQQQASLYDELIKWFGVVTAFILVGFLWRTIIGSFSSSSVEYAAFRHMLAHPSFQAEFWLGLVAPLVLVAIPAVRASNLGKVVVAGLFLAGMFAGRLEFILSAEMMPFGPLAEGRPEFVSYFPTIWEVLVPVFGISVMLMLYSLGERFLNLEAAPDHG
jgi:Ni/Fe-hydrogenase subunit HybB-like protein